MTKIHLTILILFLSVGVSSSEVSHNPSRPSNLLLVQSAALSETPKTQSAMETSQPANDVSTSKEVFETRSADHSVTQSDQTHDFPQATKSGHDLTVNNELDRFDQSQAQEDSVSSLQDHLRMDGLIDVLEVENKDIHDVLKLIALKSGLKIVADENVQGTVTIFLKNIDARDALKIILDTNSLAYEEEEGMIKVMTAEQFKQKFGYDFSERIQTEIIPLKYADGSYIVEILKQLKSDSGKVIYNDQSKTFILMDSVDELESMRNLIKQFDVPTETATIQLSYLKAEELAKQIKEVLTKDIGRIEKVNSQTNTFVVTDTPLKMKEIKELIKKMDREYTEIFIEAKVVQILLNDDHVIGVDWEAIVSNYKSLVPRKQGSSENPGSLSIAASSKNSEDQGREAIHGNEQNRLSLGTITEEDYVVLLDALDTIGVMATITNEKIKTANNKISEMRVKTKDLYFGSDGKDEEEFSDKEQVRINITPKLGNDNLLEMSIEPEIITFSKNELLNIFFDSQEGSAQGTAAIENQKENHRSTAVVTVNDGSTIVLGSLFKEVMIESTKKIPFLGDLPLFGFAFRNHGQSLRKTEIIIFLTPKVVMEEGTSLPIPN